MNIIIVGCGDVGAELAKILSTNDHNVTVIDKESRAFKRLGSGFNGAVVNGPGIDVDVLINAGIESADALAAVTSEDNVNIMVAQMARQLFGVKRVVARIYDISREHVYREFGLETVCPTILGVEQLRQVVTQKGWAQARSFGSGEVAELDLVVPESLHGRSIEEIIIPTKFLVVALVRSGKAMIPLISEQLYAGDHLTAVVRLDAMRTITHLFEVEGRK